MPSLENITSLSSFRRLFRRNNNRAPSAQRRNVRQAETPLRQPLLPPTVNHKNPIRRALSSRRVSKPNPARPTNIRPADIRPADTDPINNGRQDAQTILNQMKNGKSEELLSSACRTATSNSILERSEQHNTNEVNYYNDFHQEFQLVLRHSTLSDLKKMEKHLNSRKMKNLRQGLKLAGQTGTGGTPSQEVGPRRVTALASDHLEKLALLVHAEHDSRVVQPNTKPRTMPIFNNWHGNQTTRKKMKTLFRQLNQNINSAHGQVPRHIRDDIEADFQKLAKECENGPPNSKTKKEGGIAYAKQGKANSGELNVSDIYINDFARGIRIFNDGTKTDDSRTLGLKGTDRQAISNHLTQFCQGDANLARRLNALLTQQSLAKLLIAQIHPPMATYPNLPEGQSANFHTNADFDFHITRQPDGNMKILIHQRVYPVIATRAIPLEAQNQEGDGDKLPLNSRQSFMDVNIEVSLPETHSAAPHIDNMTYANHIVAT